MIKPIETSYAGYRFRSRTEARWAVFFDALGMKWEYEKEGFELPSGRYLPDFWLPELETWVEIKGKEPTLREMSLAAELSAQSGAPVYFGVGVPHELAEFLRVDRHRLVLPAEAARTARFEFGETPQRPVAVNPAPMVSQSPLCSDLRFFHASNGDLIDKAFRDAPSLMGEGVKVLTPHDPLPLRGYDRIAFIFDGDDEAHLGMARSYWSSARAVAVPSMTYYRAGRAGHEWEAQ